MKWPDVRDVLKGIPWAVVGAVATRLYMPERATRGLDVVVSVADAQRAETRLQEHGWRKVSSLSIGGATWRGPQGEEVDVIEGVEGWWTQALHEAQNNTPAA